MCLLIQRNQVKFLYVRKLDLDYDEAWLSSYRVRGQVPVYYLDFSKLKDAPRLPGRAEYLQRQLARFQIRLDGVFFLFVIRLDFAIQIQCNLMTDIGVLQKLLYRKLRPCHRVYFLHTFILTLILFNFCFTIITFSNQIFNYFTNQQFLKFYLHNVFLRCRKR